MLHEDLLQKEQRLLQNIKQNLPALEELLNEINDGWVEEDLTYRLYHQSFKAYYIQDYTVKIAEELSKISPHDDFNNPSDNKESKNNDYNNHFCAFFIDILQKGTSKQFDLSHNKRWLEEVLPLFTAYYQAKYFLEMSVKYGKELDSSPLPLPSGWAALLELYKIR